MKFYEVYGKREDYSSLVSGRIITLYALVFLLFALLYLSLFYFVMNVDMSPSGIYFVPKVIIPLIFFAISFLCFCGLYIAEKHCPEKININSNLSLLFYAFIISFTFMGNVFFFREFFAIPMYMCAGVMMASSYRSRKLVIYTGGFSVVMAALIASNIFEPMYVRFDNITNVANVIHCIFYMPGLVFYSEWILHQRTIYKKEAEEAEARDKAKSDFLASMSHEIRTPLNAVLGMDELIMGATEDNKVLYYASVIKDSGHLLLNTINDILDFSKIESGKITLDMCDFDTAKVIIDCYNVNIKRARDKGLSFELNIDKGLPKKLHGEANRIRQIVNNLLSNAIKYTESGSVTLGVYDIPIKDDNIELVLEVKDTGVGFSKENQARLFTAFERFDELKNRSIEGTGLGLTITEKITKALGGKIEVESEEGVGSTFKVTVPLTVVDSESIGNIYDYLNNVRPIEVYKHIFKAPRAKVLVADDVDINLVLINALLEPTEIVMDKARNGKETFDMVVNNKYDVIILDHFMPDMSGIETYRLIKELGSKCINKDTPVIMLTANAISEAKENYMEEGFADFVTKPVSPDILDQVLLRHLPKEKVIFTK